MQIRDAWMSCRGPSSRPQSALPFYADFPLETRPPTLPPRNSPSRVAGLCVIGALCVVGACSVVANAAEPVLSHSSRIVRGVRNAVDSALTHANEQAQAHADAHYVAREQMMARTPRRLQDAPARVPARSSILLRMSELRKTQSIRIDEETVQQLFPLWMDHGTWKHEAVIRDLVRAVADLSFHVSTRESAVEL